MNNNKDIRKKLQKEIDDDYDFKKPEYSQEPVFNKTPKSKIAIEKKNPYDKIEIEKKEISKIKKIGLGFVATMTAIALITGSKALSKKNNTITIVTPYTPSIQQTDYNFKKIKTFSIPLESILKTTWETQKYQKENNLNDWQIKITWEDENIIVEKYFYNIKTNQNQPCLFGKNNRENIHTCGKLPK